MYYCDPATGEVVTGLRKIGLKVYLFDDDGNAIMEDEWADIPKKEFNDDDKAELKAIEIVKAALEKLI